MTKPRILSRLLPVLVAGGALAACGGGGGSGSSATPVLGDADDAGLWQGTFSPADGAERAFGIIVAPNGQFAGIIASSGVNGRLVIGTHDTTLNVFTATGTVFAQAGQALLPNGEATDPLSVSDGSVIPHSSLTGNYVGGGESGSFVLKYDGLTSRGASLSAISGVYSAYPPAQGAPLVTLTVNGNALTFATDGGCNGAGTIDVIDPALNMYSWSMLIGACGGLSEQDLSGLATLVDNPRGGFANLLTLYGATEPAEVSFEFRGYK